MADVVDINKNKPIGQDAIKLYNFGRAIDELILLQLKDKDDFTPAEVAAVLGHRIGELLRQLDDKENALTFVIEIMKTRAGVQ